MAAFAEVVECRQRKEAVILDEYTVCSCIMALSPHTLKVILITTDYHTYRMSLVQIYIYIKNHLIYCTYLAGVFCYTKTCIYVGIREVNCDL